MLTARGLARLAVGPIELAVADGACVSIMGPSGAGKSIVLRMIADLDPHDGDAFLDGVACSSMPASTWRRRVTYVAADAGWWHPVVGAHFDAGMDVAALVATLGIAPDAVDWPVARLSTGERQRLALLRALRPDTRVLLLDEPTSGLDATSVARVEALLRARMRDGLAVVLVTHDAAQAARMADTRFVIERGTLHPAGPERA